MLRSVAVGIVVVGSAFAGSQALAAEGRVSELTAPALDAQRASRYQRGSADATAQQSTSSKVAAHSARSGKPFAGKTLREGAQVLSTRASHFYIYDAGSALLRDRDADEYHSEFRIRFDADSDVGDVRAYAKLYLRRRGETDWWLYHETDDFWIEGQSDDDDFYVTTTLDNGFPTADYDVLIDLYESGFSGIVATIGPQDTDALSWLPLEEVGLDVPIELGGYSLLGIETELVADDDGDGHYSRFRITFDPDADVQSTFVYARIWVRARGGEWIEEFVSEDWRVDTSGGADEYVLDVDWLSGYPTSYYDVQIDLYDSASDLLVASAGSERPELAQIPLEDRSRDQRVNPPPSGGSGGDTSSRESGGGAMAWWLLVLLGCAGALRARLVHR